MNANVETPEGFSDEQVVLDATLENATATVMAACKCTRLAAVRRLELAQEVLEQACDDDDDLDEIELSDIVDSAIHGAHNGDDQ